MTSVAAVAVVFRLTLPLRPQLPPPQCQPVTWELPLAQSGFNWKLNEKEGDVRGPSPDSERNPPPPHTHPAARPGACATPSLVTSPADRGYCSRTEHATGTEEAAPGWEAGEGWGGATVLEGGQARDRLCLLSSVPAHHEPEATPALAVGRFPPGSLSAPRSPWPVRSGALGWGAGRGRARGPGDGRGTRGRRDWGEGPGLPLPPPARPPGAPDREARAAGSPCALCLLRAPLLPVESEDLPLPDTYSFSSGNLPPSYPRLP